MKLFQQREAVVIVGCGRVGAALTISESEKGHGVLVIDRDERAFLRLPPDCRKFSVTADGTDPDALRDALLARTRVVVALTGSDTTNIMVAHIAKELLHVPHVIARLYDPDLGNFYRREGIETICPSELSSKEIIGILSGQLTTTESGEQRL